MTWALYDLHTEVPTAFELMGSELRAGLTRLRFRRDPERITVARWGMAETALGNARLEQWAQRQYEKDLRMFRPVGEEFEFRGHPALKVAGEAAMPFGPWIRVARHLAHRDHADQLACYFWHCAETNRIYVVQGVVDVSHRDVVAEVRDRTCCH